MDIRPAAITDIEALSALALRSKAHWGYSADQMEAWRDDLRITVEDITQNHTHVAVLDDEIVALFVLAPAATLWQLTHFWVSPAHMGRGIGKALFAFAAAFAAQHGVTAMAIDADPNAEAFYLACGAARVSSEAAPIEGDSTRIRPQMMLALRAR